MSDGWEKDEAVVTMKWPLYVCNHGNPRCHPGGRRCFEGCFFTSDPAFATNPNEPITNFEMMDQIEKEIQEGRYGT